MSFPELAFLENLLETAKDRARVTQEATVQFHNQTFPIYSIAFGSTDPSAPTLALIGGVHGQEKIGSQVVLSAMETLTELCAWDEVTHEYLKKCKIVFWPITNPVGMFLLRRGNGNRVDLMRNAPGEPKEKTTFIAGGHRISPYLPWYRGKAGEPMEVEARALCEFVKREVFPAKVAITLDCHSGYGAVDRIWFPYSGSYQPFPNLAEAFALKNLFDNTFPNHVYHIEPSCVSYTIAGDLWDYMYAEQRALYGDRHRFMPLTLEMGSWLWLKKNPAQLFSSLGLFHPMHLHRHKRILRRHITFLDFLQRAVISPKEWAFLPDHRRQELEKGALDLWYNRT